MHKMSAGSVIQKRVHEILEAGQPDDRARKVVAGFLFGLIALNVFALILETMHSVHDAAPTFFRAFEVVSVIIFSIEYVLRIWSCTVSLQYRASIRGRLRFSATPMAVIDLLAVLPFYLPFLGIDLRFARIVRMIRLLRVAKLARYSQALQTIGRVAAAKKEELVSAFIVLMVLLLFASSLMYYAEHNAQPQAFPSIPGAMWWAVCTLTTVGYGDVYPVTALGKLLGAAIAILGIGMFALPTGILGAAFVEEIGFRRVLRARCPKCGEEFDHRVVE